MLLYRYQMCAINDVTFGLLSISLFLIMTSDFRTKHSLLHINNQIYNIEYMPFSLRYITEINQYDGLLYNKSLILNLMQVIKIIVIFLITLIKVWRAIVVYWENFTILKYLGTGKKQ